MTKKNETGAELVERLLCSPMVEWSAALEETEGMIQRDAEDHAAQMAVRCGRLAGYIASRAAGESHLLAVKRQNRVAAALRKVFGYTRPEHDINF